MLSASSPARASRAMKASMAGVQPLGTATVAAVADDDDDEGAGEGILCGRGRFARAAKIVRGGGVRLGLR